MDLRTLGQGKLAGD